jgi:peptidyl-Lys metalloendopeptidase
MALSELLVGLNLPKRSLKATDRQTLEFSITNESTEPATILRWHTAFEGFKADIFQVEVQGKPVPYIGPMYKRSAPQEGDYLTIAPRGTVRTEVDLADGYDIAQIGTYSIRYKRRIRQIRSDAARASEAIGVTPDVELAHVRSNVVLFELIESRLPKTLDRLDAAVPADIMLEGPPARKTPSFSGCAQDRQTILTNALAEAVILATNARTALANASFCARFTALRYREWFGQGRQSRFDIVLNHYKAIEDALKNKAITFFCDCTSGDYAYVYPTKPYEIHLCNAFWNAPLTGTDSKAGTLIHEMSHFNVVAGTDDHVYGQSGCRDLAKTNPDDAIDNADSHEYFAENTPALDMDSRTDLFLVRTTDFWRNLPPGFGGGFNTALNGGGPFAGKCYFFKGDQYVRYDWAQDRADPGYPKNIAANWHNMPAGFEDNFDAAVNGQGPFAGKCYFFKGNQYIRYDWATDKVDPGYPKKIADNWHNLPSGFEEKFQSTMNGGGPFAGKCYFFKGDSYIRYDWGSDKTDPGYPKKISEFWRCLPATFASNIEAAIEGDQQFKGRGYFFKGDSYIRYSWAEDRAEE